MAVQLYVPVPVQQPVTEMASVKFRLLVGLLMNVPVMFPLTLQTLALMLYDPVPLALNEPFAGLIVPA